VFDYVLQVISWYWRLDRTQYAERDGIVEAGQ
jgi:hypothetical protein